MKMERIFAIPDIHGRADLLQALLTKLSLEEKMDLRSDKLIFLGDMIDRGPDSKNVIEIIRRTQKLAPKNVVVLAGNHEWLCINARTRLRLEDTQLWYWNGGLATQDSYGGMVPDEVVGWMANLPVKHEEPGFFFSHAPVPPELQRRGALRGQPFTLNELTWTHSDPEITCARVFEDGKIGVCGHIHQLRKGIKEPRFYDHYIFADAGCGCLESAPLVAIDVNSRKVIYAFPSAEVCANL
jgi:hypothetical protein